MIAGAVATAGLALMIRHVINSVAIERQLTPILTMSLAIVALSFVKDATT